MNGLGKSVIKGLPLAIFLIFLVACGKDFQRFTPYPSPGDISQFYQTVQTLSQTYPVAIDNGTVVVTDHRTLIHIPARAFVDANGNIVNGVVDLEVLEIYNKGVMMLYDRPTVAQGGLLESGGEFFIEARQNGERLDLSPGTLLRIQVPNPNPQEDMQVFYGNEQSGADFAWLPSVLDGQLAFAATSQWTWADSTSEWSDIGYEFFTDQLDWINLDKFYDVPEDQRTTVCVDLPEIYTNQNTVVYMVFNDLNSVAGIYGNAETQQFCDSRGLTPIGFDVTFVVISHRGEDIYHFGLANATIQKDHSEFIAPEERSLEEILDILGMF